MEFSKDVSIDKVINLVEKCAKREYTGLAPEVKKSIMEKF